MPWIYCIHAEHTEDRYEYYFALVQAHVLYRFGEARILTKSISRFARNTLDLLTTVRHLRERGIEIRFEKEGSNTLSVKGEVLLALLASFAQEESRSISDNVKWGTRKRFEKGIPNGRFQIYGYRWEGDHLVIHPDEAKIVRLIYDNFLKGLSAETTEKQLAEMGIKSYKGI